MLAKRIAVIESIQDLVQAKDLRRMDKTERLKRYQLLKANDVEPSEELKVSVVRVAAEEHARKMCESLQDADLQLFLSIIKPFTDDAVAFDFFHPTLASIVAEAVSSSEDPDVAMAGWGALVKYELREDNEAQDQNTADWEAGGLPFLLRSQVMCLQFMQSTPHGELAASSN